MHITIIAQKLFRPKLSRALIPIIVIVVAWSLFFWRVLTPVSADRLTFQQGDFTLQFLAYREIAYNQILNGRLPVFTECLYSGYPFQADPQSQVLYPPVMFLMLLGKALAWPSYPLRALEWEVMAHVLIAALCMYAFLRQMRLRRPAALLGALAYGFSGFLTGYAMLQTAILETAAWFPLILLSLRTLAMQPVAAGSRCLMWIRPAALLAISVALALTAGHTQSLLFMTYSSAIAYVFWCWQAKIGFRPMVVRGGIAGILAVGLSAAQLIPSLSFMLASTRASLPFSEAGNGFVLHDIALFVLTGVTNVWQPLYISIAALFTVAIAISTRRAEVWLWLGIGITALIIGFGANAVGFDLAYNIAPGYKQFHSQERHALIVVTALSILSAIGLQALLNPLRASWRRRLGRAGRRALPWAVVAFAALVAILVYVPLVVVDPKLADPGPISDRIAMIAMCLLGMGALFIWRARLGRAPRWLWVTALLGLVVFDLFTTNRYTATQLPADPFPALSLVAPISAGNDLPPGAKALGAYRINNHFGLPLNTACVNDLAEISGGSPIILRDYKTFLSRVPEDVYSQLLNVWYTVTWRGGMGTDNGRRIPDRKVATDKYQNIDANTFFLNWPAPTPQPAWVATTTTYVQTEDELYARMNADSYKPMNEAILYARDHLAIPATTQGSAGMEGKAIGYMKIAATATTPALLVVSEAYHWNWTAVVNGQEVKPILVDGALLAVPIPAGDSTVELSYRPLDLYIGAGITVATLIALGVLVVMSTLSKNNCSGFG